MKNKSIKSRKSKIRSPRKRPSISALDVAIGRINELTARVELLKPKGSSWDNFVAPTTSWTLKRMADEVHLIRGNFGILLDRRAILELAEFLYNNRHLLN